MKPQRRRHGVSTLDGVLALFLLTLGAIPLFGVLLSNLSTVRVRESDVVVMNLAFDVLETLANRADGALVVQEMLERSSSLDTGRVVALARSLARSLPRDVEAKLRDCKVVFEITRSERHPGTERTPEGAPALAVWTLRARWTDSRLKVSRTLVRIGA